MAPIRIEAWWPAAPEDEALRALAGAIVHVAVGGMVGPGPIPFGEFYRFARVVEAHLPPGSGRMCARCESRARWRIVVAWEAAYASPNGNTLCERCIDGVVVSGAEDLIFPNA